MGNKHTSLKKIHSELYKMMSYLDCLCRLHGIQYFVGYGTLLGAVREKEIIEWDDDIDIFMTSANLQKLRSLRLNHKYKLEFRDYIWRFNSCSSNYPYIDIFEIEAIGDKFTYKEKYNRNRWKDYMLRNEIYPLKYYSLGNIIVVGPHDSHSILKRCYGDYMIPKFSEPHGK